MLIAIANSSILILTALAYLVRKSAAPWLCPLCAGVAGTWMWLLGAYFAGFAVDLRIPAILLGGSVVGLAGQWEKMLANKSGTYLLVGKTLFVMAGFATVWFVTTQTWSAVAIGLVALGVITLLPWVGMSVQGTTGRPGRVERLKEQMKSCC